MHACFLWGVKARIETKSLYCRSFRVATPNVDFRSPYNMQSLKTTFLCLFFLETVGSFFLFFSLVPFLTNQDSQEMLLQSRESTCVPSHRHVEAALS